MVLIKITLLFVYISIVLYWYYYQRIKGDMNLSTRITIDGDIPKWVYGIFAVIALTFLLITACVVYLLFWVWK